MTSRPTNEELAEKISELDKDVEELLEFIRLLTDLSKIFVKITAGEIDEKIEEVLQHIGKTLGVDRTDFVRENEQVIEDELGDTDPRDPYHGKLLVLKEWLES